MPLSLDGNGPIGGATNVNGGQLAGMRNRIINGGFSINQRAVSGTVTLTAGSYGHDRFKAGASGCTYTFASSQNGNVLTISAGSLMQVIEGANLEGGTFVLSWFGTATGRVDSGTFGGSGVTGTAVAGTNQTVEFGTGTCGRVQYELGTVATTFEQRPIGMELGLCQRYFMIKIAVVTAASIYLVQVHFVPMRVTPTIGTVVFDAGTGASFGNTNPGGTLFQSSNHSQVATATIPLSAEL